MKKIIIIFCISFFCCHANVNSQPLPDSVLQKYHLAKTDEEKGRSLNTYFGNPSAVDNTTIANALKLFSLFKKQGDDAGADYAELFIANVLIFKGDFDGAINQIIPILTRFEKRKDNYGIMCASDVIGLAFMFAKNYEQAVDYYKKAITLAQTIDANDRLTRCYNNIGVLYALSSMPDSGLLYSQKSVTIDTRLKDYDHLPISLSTMAENYMSADQNDIAIPFLRKSMNYYLFKIYKRNNFGIAYVNNDFAQAFLAMQQYDSVNYYALLSIQISVPNGFREQTMRSYEYLYKSFDATKQQDSVNKYFRLAITAKDSLFSVAKTRAIEAATFREQLRQQEIASEKIKAEEERKQNIQYALMAFGIIIFVMLFLLLSRRHITNTKLIQFLGVVALLLVFEFLNLLLHPFLERITHHSPVLMLLALVCIAALLVPLHHKLEKWATHKLVEKNKVIRLKAAKKTIEELEKS